MSISSLVITLDPDATLASRAAAAIERDSRIEVGSRRGAKLPVVVETSGPGEDMRVVGWLQSLDGVRFVDVVCVHLDERGSSTRDDAQEAGRACGSG